MLKMIAVTALAAPVAVAGMAAGTGVMVVDVNPSDGPRIIVPVPLLAAQIAAHFVPEEVRRLDLEELDELNLPALRGVIEALRDVPDAELVRVESRDELVLITKRGDTLEVIVDGAREQVEVTVPLAVVERVIDQDGEIRLADVISELRHQRWTDLVNVYDGDDRVRIWVF